jgi:anaphase-promoting complex subunit 2
MITPPDLSSPSTLLAAVSAPIKSYLRRRKDTVRCVISSIIEEGGELEAEMKVEVEEKEEDNDPDKWVPEGMETHPVRIMNIEIQLQTCLKFRD